MISSYVIEKQRYTQKELCAILDLSEERLVPLIRMLKRYGILRTVRKSDYKTDLTEISEDDIVISDVEIGDDEHQYVFTYVGIIDIFGIIIKCYPKYLLNEKDPVYKLKQIVKVIEKYNSKEQIVRMYNETDESKAFNLLAVFLFLLDDYFENGVYNDTEEIIESNGSGEILWDKTINETFTLISKNRPFYPNLQTKKRINDDFDYFKRLHEFVLTTASKELEEAALLDIFGINSVDLSDEDLDDFGDKEYILYRIEKELNIQFNTRKQLVLKTIYAYINQSGSLLDTDSISLFGTNSFNLVWEDVCKVIYDNQLDTPLSALKLPKPLKSSYAGNSKLIEIIEKPFWSAAGKDANDTLIPDLVSIHGNEFIIFDAKYYCPTLEEGKVPMGQPGIESITKQYLYQLAYKDFIKDQGFVSVKNCFLLPTNKDEVEAKGEASMKMLSQLGLQNIEIRFIPAEEAYEHYLTGRKMDIKQLAL